MNILVVNAGSSTHKFSLYQLKDEKPIVPLWEAALDWGMKDKPMTLEVKTAKGKIEQKIDEREVKKGIETLLKTLWEGENAVIEGPAAIQKVGHRVVHGGSQFEQPTLITHEVKEHIRQLIPLAPLHNPSSLQGIEIMQAVFPIVPHIAVFDTAFHLSMPEMIKTYPLPLEWKEKGVQRYGFHGISHHYCAERVAEYLNEDNLKIINCHLGNGCSLCAIKDGKSFETTMGLTPLEGLMMGTRCGSIDPGILFYLMREYHLPVEELDKTLNLSSGLKGISGQSDMRELLKSQDAYAKLAVEMFVHRLTSFIGALAASLEGFHVLNFTAGIGENAAPIREAVCKKLSFLNLTLDNAKNRTCKPDALISSPDSAIQVLVLHTREEWMIARACLQF